MGSFELHRNESPVSDAERQAVVAKPVFGTVFTDHMAVINYTTGEGWHDPRLVATTNFKMHPAAAVLHYGQEIFEGLKAYRHADDSIWLFRPRRTRNAWCRLPSDWRWRCCQKSSSWLQ